jgi:glucose-6-phosphate 1-dehydrogenase
MVPFVTNRREIEQPPLAPPCGIVIFGASGPRAQQGIVPALYSLFVDNQLPDEFFILGVGRSSFSDESFRTALAHVLGQDADDFSQHCFYLQGDYQHSAAYVELWEKLTALHASYGTGGNVLYVLTTPRTMYEAITGHLNNTGLIKRHQNHAPYQRLLLEKPFDVPGATDHTVTRHMLRFASDDQIYRMDCLLHPMAISRMLLFRLTNPLFARQWDRSCIDRIDIRYEQQTGLEGQSRHFDDIGLVRHLLPGMLLHVLAPVTLEPPAQLEGDALRDEQTKLLRAIRSIEPTQLQISQYTANHALKLTGYDAEHGEPAPSRTETRFAVQLAIDNQRWRDVPIHLDAGIGMADDCTEVTVHFRDLAHPLVPGQQKVASNVLHMELQPVFKIELGCRILHSEGAHTLSSVNSMLVNLPADQDVSAACSAHLLAALRGEQSPFWRSDTMEAVWKLLAPILRLIDEERLPLQYYQRGKN